MKGAPVSSRNLPGWLFPIVSLFLVALIWAVFCQTIGHDFVNYDDKTYVYGNSLVDSGLNVSGLARAFVDTRTGNWHPLTLISHMIDVQFYGLKAGGHHFTNVLLHGLGAILLFLALQELMAGNKSSGTVAALYERRPAESKVSPAVIDRRYNFWASAFVAAIFAIHPLRVESVAWIAERKDVLSGVFFMLTLGAYGRYVRKKSAGRYFAVIIVFACGLMSKPMLVTVPLVLLLLDYWPLNRQQSAKSKEQRIDWRMVRGLVVEKIPLFVLSAFSSAITFIIQEHSAGAIAQLPISWRIQNAAISYVTYLRQLFWPVDLAVFYPHPENHLGLWQTVLATLFLISITAITFALRKKYPYLIVGWLWYLIMLIPVIGIVEVGLQGHADRYTYLPQIGLYIAITWLIADWARSIQLAPKVVAGAGAATILVLSACSWKQTTYWRSSETLWQRALAVTDRNDVAHANLGMFLMDRGQFDDALANFQTALDIRTASVVPVLGHYDLSLALIHGDIGNALVQKGQLDEAIVHLRKAIEFQPDYADAHYNLGTALFQKGEIDEAIMEFRKALSIRPDDSDAHTSLGNALVQKKMLSDAIHEYRLALQFSPYSVLPLNNLAWLQSASVDGSLRNGTEAVQLATRANQNSGNSNPIFVRTLAAAYAEAGQFEKAEEIAERALQLASTQGQRGLEAQIQEDLDGYRRHIALRDDSLTNAH